MCNLLLFVESTSRLSSKLLQVTMFCSSEATWLIASKETQLSGIILSMSVCFFADLLFIVTVAMEDYNCVRRSQDQSDGIYNRYSRDLWQCKQTLSSGFALGLGSFTAINPWPRAITIT